MSLHKVPCQSDSSTHLAHAASEVRLHRLIAFSALCGFPFPYQHMGCLCSRPAGTQGHPSLFCSLLTWVCPGMPEVNGTANTQTTGLNLVADKII